MKLKYLSFLLLLTLMFSVSASANVRPAPVNPSFRNRITVVQVDVKAVLAQKTGMRASRLLLADDNCVHGGHEPVIIVVDNQEYCVEYCGPPCDDPPTAGRALPTGLRTDRPYRMPLPRYPQDVPANRSIPPTEPTAPILP